jgi:hypothetical protein
VVATSARAAADGDVEAVSGAGATVVGGAGGTIAGVGGAGGTVVTTDADLAALSVTGGRNCAAERVTAEQAESESSAASVPRAARTMVLSGGIGDGWPAATAPRWTALPSRR